MIHPQASPCFSESRPSNAPLDDLCLLQSRIGEAIVVVLNKILGFHFGVAYIEAARSFIMNYDHERHS
jgi:hypothetical protein